MRILIIEDDKSLAETLRFQLEREHFETDICHDGVDGLHFIEQQAHDLILLDRMIPVLDGISVLKITRKKDIYTPIIFITAMGALQDKVTGLECGAREGNLLEIFLRNPGMTIPRASLLSRVWGPDASVEDGNLDNYIYLLRRRLKGVRSTLQLKTVRGIGYRLEVPYV